VSSDQVVSVLAAITALVVATSVLLQRIESLRAAVNGALHELVSAKAEAAAKQGELEGRDFIARLKNPPPD
jgi:Arc/MetJ family transcription regulator